MITIPFYNLLILPDVTLYFQKEFYVEMAKKEPEQGEELAFVMLKEEKEREEITEQDIYPVGVYGVVVGFGDNGSVQVQTKERFHVDAFYVEDGKIELETSPRQDVVDITEEEQKKRFKQLQSSIINTIKSNDWSPMAVSYIMHVKSINDLAVSFAQQFKCRALWSRKTEASYFAAVGRYEPQKIPIRIHFIVCGCTGNREDQYRTKHC